MPVEVKELVIRVHMPDDGSTGNADTESSADYSTDRIVEMCVEQVLQILEHARER